MVVWEERKLPEFGANGFAPPLEKDGVVGLFEDGDCICVKEDTAAVVTEFADANKVVFEGGHNVAFLDGEIGEEVGGLGRRLVGVASGIANVGQWGGGAYVGNGSTRGEVDVTGTGVNDA